MKAESVLALALVIASLCVPFVILAQVSNALVIVEFTRP
jgi:hypothetical protein